jgi:hypothetical protein
VDRADGEGYVICECPGCAAPHHYPQEKQVPALWWLERGDVAEQLCGTCANVRTSAAERGRVLRRLDAEEEDEDAG